MTCFDVVPLSAMATMCDEQFENTGAETSVNVKNIYFKKQKSIWNLNRYSQSAS